MPAGSHHQEIVFAALEVVSSILAVEHRVVQPHLPALWKALWGIGTTDVSTTILGSLLAAYRDLRQLEVLLGSLAESVIASDEAESGTTLMLFGTTAFAKSIDAAVKAAPSGQTATLVRLVASWVNAFDPPAHLPPATALALAAVASACLASLAVTVVVAPPVAHACQELVSCLARPMAAHFAAVEETPGEERRGAYVAALLMLYTTALQLHMRCCLLHPEIAPLPGQELQISFSEMQGESSILAQRSYFDAVNNHKIVGGSVLDAHSYGNLWALASLDNSQHCTPALRGSICVAAAHRIFVLYHQKLHVVHRCRGGGGDTSGVLAAVDKEIEFLASILLQNINKNASNAYDPVAGVEDWAVLGIMGTTSISDVVARLLLRPPTLEAIQGVVKVEDLVLVSELVLGSDHTRSFRVFREPRMRATLAHAVARKLHEILR